MMIIDAISNAHNDHAVWFLVTAYLESLQHFHGSLGLPLTVVALPVSGIADLRARIAMLRSCHGARVDASAPPAELCAVLRAAIERLDTQVACENR